MTTPIAALYVDPRGCYANLPGVDVWDEQCANDVSSGETRPRVGRRAAAATPEAFRNELIAMARTVDPRTTQRQRWAPSAATPEAFRDELIAMARSSR